MAISAIWRYRNSGCCAQTRSAAGELTMTMLLIAGIAALAAGLLAIVLGIPIKEFSFGNTLILAGAASACTGLILFGLAMVVRELQRIGRRLAASPAVDIA